MPTTIQSGNRALATRRVRLGRIIAVVSLIGIVVFAVLAFG